MKNLAFSVSKKVKCYNECAFVVNSTQNKMNNIWTIFDRVSHSE